MSFVNLTYGNRRDFLATGAAAMGAACTTALMRDTSLWAADSSATVARRVSAGSPQIFVDLDGIEPLENVRQLFHAAEKHPGNPVLAGEKPWEAQAYSPTASVIYDDGENIFKCWYMGILGDVAGPTNSYGKHVLCYATSKDGIHWDRPNLGLHDYDGSKKNNIVIPETHHDGADHWESVLKDPFDPDPQRRYKAFGWTSYPTSAEGGLQTMTSPDGLNWTHSSGVVVPGGDAQALMIDAPRKRYVLFVRSGPRATYESTDFIHWSAPTESLDWNYPGGVYNHIGFVYGDAYLGLVSWYQTHNHHLMDVRLMSSQDGLRYHLPGPDPLSRPPLIGMGEVGQWDRMQVRLTGAPPIRVKDKLYLYYRGFSISHDKDRPPDDNYYAGAIGLATLRLDGFASLGAGFDGGRVTTKPITFAGKTLTINANAKHHAHVFVEALDESGSPIPGYTKEDCVPLTEDAVAHVVQWRQHRDLGALAERPVRLRFYLNNAQLYSFTVT